MVSLAKIERGMCILEPEAGQAAIIEAIFRAFPFSLPYPTGCDKNDEAVTVDYCELSDDNAKVISEKLYRNQTWCYRASYMCNDFLKFTPSEFYQPGTYLHNGYDRIIANPPFTKNQDIDHIYHMFDVCRENGRIVTCASNHWRKSPNKKEHEFRQFLTNLKATIIDLPTGTFKESGTNIAACVLIIDKKKN